MLGIRNGFQILREAHLLPGALTRNSGLCFFSDSRDNLQHVGQLPAGS